MEGGNDNFDLRRPESDKRRGRVRLVPDPPSDTSLSDPGDIATLTGDPEVVDAPARPAPLRKTSSRVTVPRAPLPAPEPVSEPLTWRTEPEAGPAGPVEPVASPARPTVVPSDAPAQLGSKEPTVPTDLRRSEPEARSLSRPRRAVLTLAGAVLIALAAAITLIAGASSHHSSTSTSINNVRHSVDASGTTPTALSPAIAAVMASASPGALKAELHELLGPSAAGNAKEAAVRKAAAAKAAEHKAAEHKAAEQRAAKHEATERTTSQHATSSQAATTSSPAAAPQSSSDDVPAAQSTPAPVTSSATGTQSSSSQGSSSTGSTSSSSGPTGLGNSSGCNPKCS